ncbi:MAG: YSIRK-type signal peptide-containing protein [Lactobacillus sp.]|nr:YSIRK-type signal peptide-containing protein [Lactobacillus sp.]
MLSKNNRQEQFRKQESKKQRFAIKKLTVGVASVLIGFTFMGLNTQASADDTPTQPANSSDNAQSEVNTSTALQSAATITLNNDGSQNNGALQQANSASVTKPDSDTAVSKESQQVIEDNANTKTTAQTSTSAPVESNSSLTSSNVVTYNNVNNLSTDLSGTVESKLAATPATDKTEVTTNTLNFDSKTLLTNLAVTNTSNAQNTADVANFADLSKAIANKDITTINITQDIDLTNMTEAESQVDGGLVSGGTTGKNWLQKYELAANKTSNSPFTSIARALTINGNDHTVNLGKWFISLWNQNQDNTNGWKLTFNDMKVKNDSTSTRYTPIYFGNMNSANLKKVTLTFNNFQADLNTPLTNDEDGVDVIFKGKDVINVSPLANNATGSVQSGADRNIIYARNVLIDDNADVSITASMTGSFGFGSVQDEEHNVIKLSPDTSDSSDPAGSMAVGKNAKLTINTNGIDGKGSTTSLRGIASRNVNGTLTLNEGATVNMTLGKGHSSAVLLSNLDLKKGSTLNIDTQQDNSGTTNTFADGSYYAPIALAAINFSSASNASLRVANGATLKMTRGNVDGNTPMIMIGGSTVFGGNNYIVDFEDGSTVDIQDASTNSSKYGLIYEVKSNTPIKIGQVKYLNLQRTGGDTNTLIDSSAGVSLDAGKFGGVDIKQWNKGNTGEIPTSTWQVENFTTKQDGTVSTAGMAPVDDDQQANFTKDFNILGNEKTSGVFSKTVIKPGVQRLVMTSMDLEAYNYDARYKDSTAKVGETINIDAPTFYQVGEGGTLTPANPNPDLLDNTMSGHPYQLGWAQTGNITIPQGATIDPATGKITFTANQGQVGTVVYIPVTVTYKDDSIDQVIAPVYVLGNDTTPVWQKDENGNTTGVVVIQYAAGNLPETTDKSAQVKNIADNYKLTYYAIPTKDNPEVTPVDITNYGKVSWAKAPSTVVDTPSNNETITAPVSISFAPDSFVVKNGYVKGGTQTVDLNLDLTGATAKNTDLGFSKKSIDSGLTQTQFKRLVDTTALDNAGISYTLSWAETPTTKAQNNGVVRVTYSSVMQADGTTPAYLDIPVQYKVNDPEQTADGVDVTYPITATSAKETATITPVITDNDGKTIEVPAGTKFAIDGNAPAGATINSSTGVVTIPATNTTSVTTIPVTVTYSDGSTTQITVKSVSVATNDDVKNPTSPYDMIKDPANLPAGTKVTWADDNTPVAGDNVPANVIVTVPGAEPIEITGTAHYDDSAIYTPQVKNPVQAIPEQLPDAKDQITNMNDLPEGTTAAWQDGQQVPVTADQTIPGVIVVTYPDGTTDKVSTTITTTGITDADQYTPEPATDLTTTVGKIPEAVKGIANADEMPTGTTYTWIKEPDVSKPGNTTGEVTVTYPDGTADTVTVPVKVSSDADQYTPEPATDLTTTVGKIPEAAKGIANADEMPTGTTYTWTKEPDVSKLGSTTGEVTVTYPDGTTDIVTVPVSVIGTTQDGDDSTYYGTMTRTTFTVDPINTHKTTNGSANLDPGKFNKIVVESDWNKNTGNYDKTVTYILSDDGTTYVNEADPNDTFAANEISYTWQDGFKPNTNVDQFNGNTGDTLANDPIEKTTTGNLAGNSKYRVNATVSGDAATKLLVSPGSTTWHNQYINFYGATANDGLTAIHNDKNSIPEAEKAVNESQLTSAHNAEISSTVWQTYPNISKIGNTTGTVRINFNDDTYLDVEVPVKVVGNDADIYTARYYDTYYVVDVNGKITGDLAQPIHFYKAGNLTMILPTDEVPTGSSYTKYTGSIGGSRTLGWEYANLDESTGQINFIKDQLANAKNGVYYLPVIVNFNDGSSLKVLEKLNVQINAKQDLVDTHELKITGSYKGPLPSQNQKLNNQNLTLKVTANDGNGHKIDQTWSGDQLKDVTATVVADNKVKIDFGDFGIEHGYFGVDYTANDITITDTDDRTASNRPTASNRMMLFSFLLTIDPHDNIAVKDLDASTNTEDTTSSPVSNDQNNSSVGTPLTEPELPTYTGDERETNGADLTQDALPTYTGAVSGTPETQPTLPASQDDSTISETTNTQSQATQPQLVEPQPTTAAKVANDDISATTVASVPTEKSAQLVAKKLPQTGNNNNRSLSVAGLALSGLISMFGLARITKKNS